MVPKNSGFHKQFLILLAKWILVLLPPKWCCPEWKFIIKKKKTKHNAFCQPTLKLASRQSPELGSHQLLRFGNKIMIAYCYLLGTSDFPYSLNFNLFTAMLPKHTWFRKENWRWNVDFKNQKTHCLFYFSHWKQINKQLYTWIVENWCLSIFTKSIGMKIA